jgi:membrane protein
MAKPSISWMLTLQNRALDFIEERTADSRTLGPAVRRTRSFIQFVYLVGRGFTLNRCPLRAAALCYTTLLALVPVLAVAFVFAKGLLKESAVTAVPEFLDTFVARVAPQLELSAAGRQQVVDQLQSFIGNIDAGALGVIGMIALVFVAIRLLMTVEQTFNDIWGVPEGRSIWRKIVYYWAAISLGPIVLLTATALTGRAEFAQAMSAIPGGHRLLLKLTPYLVLWAGFALLYGLMPNTRVQWRAALIGGLVAGTLWQLNSQLNTMYFSRVVTYSKIYGSIGIIPVFLLGVYFSWLIVLFGAQVSFAAQNYRSYIQQRATDRVDQAGREQLACRIVLAACERFLAGNPPPRITELCELLTAPPQLANQLIPRLTEAGILTVTSNPDGGLIPARLPETLRVADVLLALRAETPIVAGEDAVGRSLTALRAAQEQSAANATFRDLAGRQENA